MPKQISFSDDARQLLMVGINKLARAVVTTLGPRGRNVALDKKWGAPSIIHDGVTVAKEIELENPYENMGAQLVKEAASKTNDIAGDGTTTATLLAQQIVKAGMKHITAGANPMQMKTGIDKAVKVVIKELDKLKKEVKDTDWQSVATISAQNKQVGAKIAEALKLVGKNGVVEVADGKGLDLEIEHKEGMSFDKGYASAYFVTDTNKMEAKIDDAHILITDQKISSMSDLLPFLEKFVKISKNLVIIADDIEGEALATLVVNKMRGTFNVLAVKAPAFGDRRKAVLEDIAILTGATVISEDVGRKLDSVEIEDLGRADSVISAQEETRIVGGRGNKANLNARVAQLQTAVENSDSEFDREKLQERLAKLEGGVAVINIGAATEVELNEIKARVQDAVGATKAAIEEGIVPGGGVALLRASKALDNLNLDHVDEQIGVKVVQAALSQPIRWLAKNAGADEGWVVRKVAGSKNKNYGYNALTLKFEQDMLKAGIVDPVKVTKSALLNGASISTMILTTEALITDIPEKDKPAPMPAGGMGGGMPGMM